jgi:hypothetical protein
MKPALLVAGCGGESGSGVFEDSTWRLATVNAAGESGPALGAYRIVLDLWRCPDPELQPLAAEARDATARLAKRQP